LLQLVDTIYRQRPNRCLKYNLTWNMLCWLFEKTEHVDGKQIKYVHYILNSDTTLLRSSKLTIIFLWLLGCE